MTTPCLWTSDAMATAMGAARSGVLPDCITGISIDSRTLQPGEAYFAIKGDVHDGHAFVGAALAAGAALAVPRWRWWRATSAISSLPMPRC